MQKLISSNVRKYTNWLVSRKSALSWSPFLKERKLLRTFILRIVGFSVLGKKTRSLSGAAIMFSRTVVRLYKSNGTPGVVNYLKKCQLLLMQSVGHSDRRPVCLPDSPRVATTRTGVPRIIPSAQRKLIEKGDARMIQFWMTLFGFHRVLTMKGRWKISSIYNGYTNWKIPLRISSSYVGVSSEGSPLGFRHYIPEFLVRLRRLDGLSKLPQPDWKFDPLLINSLGPNSSSGYKSMFTAPQDALAWSTSPLYPALKRFCELTKMDKVIELIERCSYMSTVECISIHDTAIEFKEPYYPGTRKKKRFNPMTTNPEDLIFTPRIFSSPFIRWAPNLLSKKIEALGRLSFKREKSGKIRVFAMVDYWTQCLMSPLHDCIFAILKRIPQDATFDQQGSVESFARSLGPRARVFSYDLSSATDRLPVVLQVEVLSQLLRSPELAVLWAMLLTCRPYFVKRKSKGDTVPRWGMHQNKPAILDYPLTRGLFPEYCNALDQAKQEVYTCNKRVYYAVGQPMGALTSWGMLALTHHFIVQLAYMKAYPESPVWFREYRVLGDDCVIAEERVAKYYRQLMQLLGVPLNESKGIVSDNGSFEFAKTFWYKTQEVSPHSWADMRLGTSSLAGMILLFTKKRRKTRFSLQQLARAFGYGSVVASRVMKNYGELYKLHPRLLPFLFMATFPDTTPASFKRFSVWLRAERASPITSLIPEDYISDHAKAFWKRFLRPQESGLHSSYHIRSFDNYFHKTGSNALKVLQEIEGLINLRIKDAFQEALMDRDVLHVDLRVSKDESMSARIDNEYRRYVIGAEALDRFPAWFTPQLEDDFPKEVKKVNGWTRYKLQPFFKHYAPNKV